MKRKTRLGLYIVLGCLAVPVVGLIASFFLPSLMRGVDSASAATAWIPEYAVMFAIFRAIVWLLIWQFFPRIVGLFLRLKGHTTTDEQRALMVQLGNSIMPFILLLDIVVLNLPMWLSLLGY